MVVDQAWLLKNFDKYHVILDTRSADDGANMHIKSAVSFPAAELVKMGKDFKARKFKRSKKLLPGLADKKAPVIVYGSAGRSADVMSAYKELVYWGYKNTVVLDGGIKVWKQGGLPVSNATPGLKISYVRKPVKGAVDSSKFTGLVKAGKYVVLDVRNKKEAANGKIASSIHIPLDELEANLAQFDKSADIVTHCVSGVRAGIAYQLLQKNGFKNAKFLNAIIKIDKNGKYTIE